MSASICTDKQTVILAIASLLDHTKKYKILPDNEAILKRANLFRRANYKGVRAEYSHHTGKRFLEMFGKYVRITSVGTIEEPALSKIAIYKLADNFDYQCCSAKDWERSTAYKLLVKLRYDLTVGIMQGLPEYNLAEWGL